MLSQQNLIKKSQTLSYDHCKSKIDTLRHFWFSKCCASIQLPPITWVF